MSINFRRANPTGMSNDFETTLYQRLQHSHKAKSKLFNIYLLVTKSTKNNLSNKSKFHYWPPDLYAPDLYALLYRRRRIENLLVLKLPEPFYRKNPVTYIYIFCTTIF